MVVLSGFVALFIPSVLVPNARGSVAGLPPHI
jgi:hypothetical protein